MATTNWKLESAGDVAQALDWVRRRMEGNGLVLVAIGANSVAFSKDAKLAPEDAADLIARQVEVLREGFQQITDEKVTRGCKRRRE